MSQLRKGTSLTGSILQVAAVVTQLSLLLCYLAAYISPAKIWLLEFFALGYLPILIVTLAVAFLCYLANQRIYILSLILVLLDYNLLQSHIQLAPSTYNSTEETGSAVKVMSFNSRLFDLYNWTNNSHTQADIFELFKEEAPEILCIQEFHTSKKDGRDNLKALKKMKANKVHVAYTTTLRKTEHWGMATLTTYPIINKGTIPFNESTNNICIFTDIKIKKDTVRVYNVHFQSNRFVREDYEFLDKPIEKKNEEKVNASLKIIRRIKNASVKRARQVDLVKAHMASSPYPVIICGDFNDTPASYTYHQISENLSDAFVESGQGFGNTFIGLSVLPLRIDYLLHSPVFKSYNFKVIKKRLSDHYPITAIINLRPEK